MTSGTAERRSGYQERTFNFGTLRTAQTDRDFKNALPDRKNTFSGHRGRLGITTDRLSRRCRDFRMFNTYLTENLTHHPSARGRKPSGNPASATDLAKKEKGREAGDLSGYRERVRHRVPIPNPTTYALEACGCLFAIKDGVLKPTYSIVTNPRFASKRDHHTRLCGGFRNVR